MVTGKKHILHIITRFIPGGADENTLYTIRGLDKTRFQVDLMVGGESDVGFVGLAQPDAKIIWLPELVRDIAPVQDLAALAKMVRVIRKGNYDLVHTHTAKAGFLGRLAAILARCPLIVHSLHGITFHQHLPAPARRLYLQLERLVGRYTRQFIAVGDEIRQIYQEHRVGPNAAFCTIRSGFDIRPFTRVAHLPASAIQDLRRREGFGDDQILIGSVSRLEARKGHEYLLQAARLICPHQPKVRFLIAGAGPRRTALEKLTQQWRLEDSVYFLGHRIDIFNVMAMMDVLALTSLWEGLPRVLVQAAAAGRPIVTFKVEGAEEIVNDGENGFIVPAKNVVLLAEKLLFCANNLPTMRKMGKCGLNKVDSSWQIETMVKKITAVYDDLLQSFNGERN